jgi:hypothetical protein
VNWRTLGEVRPPVVRDPCRLRKEATDDEAALALGHSGTDAHHQDPVVALSEPRPPEDLIWRNQAQGVRHEGSRDEWEHRHQPYSKHPPPV